MVTYTRKAFLAAIDVVLINLSVFISLALRFDAHIPVQYLNIFLHSFILLTLMNIFIFYLFGLYRSLWRYASIDELIQILFAAVIASICNFIFGYFLDMMYPRSVYTFAGVLTFILLGGSRLSYRVLRRVKNFSVRKEDHKTRVMIIGAGDAGAMVIRELKKHSELSCLPVAVIDDNRAKHKNNIHGVPVRGGRNKIIEIARKEKIDEIIVAIPSAKKFQLAELLDICKETKCRLKTLPGVYELINGAVDIKNIRDVSIEDLLGRDESKIDVQGIAGYLDNETVLVTGGGGSIGSELCRQIAKFRPRKLLIFDIYENNAYDLQNELLSVYKNKKIGLEVLIGSVRDKERLKEIFELHKPGVVFHAAAHKHVPLMEANPAEAIKNNVLGTLNVAQCADKYGVKRFVLISTDKAVNPTNIMGASKRLCEMIVQSLDKHSETEFVAVRFGNVLGSNGSVIPLFKRQIARGGPVTVTHPEITRYFMTIPEAVRLVIQAGAMAKGGEIFILDMGDSVKIVDLAKDLIRLSGFEPEVDIKIEFTGLRPGEKLYEELLLAEEGMKSTSHREIFIGSPLELSFNEILLWIRALENSLSDPEELKECMAKIVPTYQYEQKESVTIGYRLSPTNTN